jgi:hypothetical protein
MANQDHIGQVSVLEQANDVGDVSVEAYCPAQQMGALAEPGQRRLDHRMTNGTKIGSDVPPAPPAEPRTRDEEKRRHDWAQEKTGE